MATDKSLHKNITQRFRENGFEGMEQSEVLMALLGYTIPADELEEKSNLLLSKLGNLSSVMDMRVEGLMRIGDISEYSAVLLNIIPGVLRRRQTDVIEKGKLCFKSIAEVAEYCIARYFGFTDEVLSLVMLDNNGMLVGYEVIQVGSRASANVNLEKIAQLLFSYDAPNFLLVHNHPDGNLTPSDIDIQVTEVIEVRFSALGKNLLDHLIVCHDRYMPIKHYQTVRYKRRKL